jgi:hypothetical protein
MQKALVDITRYVFHLLLVHFSVQASGDVDINVQNQQGRSDAARRTGRLGSVLSRNDKHHISWNSISDQQTIQANDAGRASQDFLGSLIQVVKRWVSPQDSEEIDELQNRRSHDSDGPLHPLFCETLCIL